MATGAYKLLNNATGMFYIGGAYASFENREQWHRKALRGNYHFNQYLQRAWNKYGEAQFMFEVIEECEPDDVATVEQKWLDHYNAGDKVQTYNLSPFANKPPSALGLKRTNETKAKMSEALKGNTNTLGHKHTDEAKERMSKSALARIAADPEYLRKFSDIHTDEVRQKISESLNEFWNGNNEAKIAASERAKITLADEAVLQRLSDAAQSQWNDPIAREKKLAGIRAAQTEEHRKVQSEAQKTSWANEESRKRRLAAVSTPERRAQISAKLRGRPVSEETQAKLAAKAREQHERQRAAKLTQACKIADESEAGVA